MLDKKTKESLKEALMKRMGTIAVLTSFTLFFFFVPYCSSNEYCVLQEKNCSGFQHVACGIQPGTWSPTCQGVNTDLSVLSQDDIGLIVKTVNQYRRGKKHLVWDKELAGLAQQYVQLCDINSEPMCFNVKRFEARMISSTNLLDEKVSSIDWANATRKFESALNTVPFDASFIGCGVATNWEGPEMFKDNKTSYLEYYACVYGPATEDASV